jgi:HK97 family phage major capsid protein
MRIIEQLRADHLKECAAAKNLLENSKPFTNENKTAFDAHLKRAEELKCELERRESSRDWLRTHEGPISERDTHEESRANVWVDTKNDRRIRVLNPNESLRKHITPAGGFREQEGLGFGRFVRAMVLGGQTDAEKRALSEGTDSAGGYTVPSPLSAELLDRLRAKSVCIKAGAKTVPFDSATLQIARLATDPTTTWRAENAAISASDPTFDAVLFTARTLAGIVVASRELLDDSLNVDEALLHAFSASMGAEVDRVALLGTGTPPQPLGISNTSGISTTSMGTNGASITSYDDLLTALQALRTANAADPTAAIMSPRTEATYNKLKDSLGQPLRRPNAIADLPFLVTSKMPVTETQGTATTASRIITGNFAELMIGIRTQVRIDVLKETFATNGQIGFVAWMRADIQLMHAASFAQIVGII